MVARNTIDNVCTWCDKEFKSERGVAIHQRICNERPQTSDKCVNMTAAAPVAQPTKSHDPAVDDSDMLLTNERIWMLKHRPAMFDKEMEVQHIERRGKVEREAYEMQLRDREICMQEAMANVQLDTWKAERKEYVVRIAALEEVVRSHTTRLAALAGVSGERIAALERVTTSLCSSSQP